MRRSRVWRELSTHARHVSLRKDAKSQARFFRDSHGSVGWRIALNPHR